MNQRKLLLIALMVLAALLIIKPSCLSPTTKKAKRSVPEIATKAKDVISTAISVPIGMLQSIPKMAESGPPGFTETFGQKCSSDKFDPSTGMCSETFGQENVPAAGTCPSFSEMCRAASKESTLLSEDAPNMGFGSATGEDGNYASIAETLAAATGDWVGNFKNDAGANSTYLDTFDSDPSRQTAIKAPNATVNSSLRSDEPINFDPAAICKLSGRLSKLMSDQGLKS